jgi:hypothetical protein
MSTTLEEMTQKFMTDVAAAKAAFKQEGETLLKAVTKQFFAENPLVKAIKWDQYTPYFNDGDSCEFSVNDPMFINTDDADALSDCRWEEYQGEDESVEVYTEWGGDFTEISKEMKDNIRMFSKFICSDEMSDVMESVFDDHSTITVTANGFDVDELDHD